MPGPFIEIPPAFHNSSTVGLAVCELEPARVAPGEKPRHGRGVRRACVRVADLGGEKLHRPLRGLWPGAPDRGREALDLPAPPAP